ncbi:hypothetical protein KAX17_18405 [Candidatus Bipolaricaulota bacterium]|nr:hypothetical protein [Candidatus Bipolaricaulota bacterium]
MMMWNRERSQGVCLALTILGLSMSLGGFATQEAPTCMLSIEADADLAALEGTTGQGTEEDPYIIERLNIDAQGEEYGLRIANTTAFFIIRNGTFAGASASAICLENVHNGWISECVIENNEVGVRLDAETSGMTFTLNTLRNNETDVIDHSQSTNWDDGYAGNWWGSYEGIDENHDGIGDTEYTFPLPERQETYGVDHFPLVEPFVGGEAPPPGKVRLEVKYEFGDRFEFTLSMQMSMEMVMGFVPINTEIESDMVLIEEVTAAAGYGIYNLRQTVVEDTGRITVNGMAQPYPSDAGTVIKPRIYRFGSMIDPGDIIGAEESFGLNIPVQFPVRYIGVGDTWSSVWTLGAEALGIPDGEATYTNHYTLDRFEEWNGKQCAVIIAQVDVTAKGREVDPLFGTILYSGTGSAETTLFIDLRNGRMVNQMGTIQMAVDILSATGARIGEMRLEITAEAPDRVEITEEPFAVEQLRLADLESKLEQVRADYLAQIADLQSQLEQVHAALAALEEKATAPLKIAYINAEAAFTVFTDAVRDLRQEAIDKQMEIAKLQQDFMAGTISKDEYQNTNNRLQVELLQAQLNINIGTIDKMIASPGFSDMRSDLQRLRDEAQPVIDEMKNLVVVVRVGVVDTQEFENRYTQVKNAFTQLDQLLTKAATTKIVQAAEKVALENGYDLVLRVKNVIIYRNAAKLIDITDLVKHELATYL